MKTFSATIRMGAARDVVTVTRDGNTLMFDRAAMRVAARPTKDYSQLDALRNGMVALMKDEIVATRQKRKQRTH